MFKKPPYPDVVNTFLEIVPINNLSGNEDELTLWLVDKLTAFGLDSLEQDNIGNVIAKIYSNIPKNKETIMFVAHLDSVPPCEKIEPLITKVGDDHIITSASKTILSADDKAGIAAIIEAIKTIKNGDFKYPNIELVFTVQEEVGLKGAKELNYSEFHSKIAYAIDAEAPVGTIITQGPTQKKFTIDFWGKSSHAGMAPEKGVNSIVMASEFLDKISLGRIDHATTSNIGIIGGGTANNVIPEHTVLQGEVRSLYESKLEGLLASYKVEAQKAVDNLNGKKFEFNEYFVYHNFFIEFNSPVVQLASRACQNINLEPIIKEIGSGSDANIFNYNGISTVILGTGFKKSHSLEESITFSELKAISNLIINIIKEATNQI